MRQRDPGFSEQMDRLGNRTFTEQDYDNWASTMDLNNMSSDRQKMFIETGTKLCGMKKDMGDFNERGIKRLGQPICRSLAENNCPQAKESSSNEAENLMNELYLAKGAKVVLTKNLWSQAGLVNGAQGTVKYIIYAEGSQTSADTMPDMLLVHFPGYKGPSFLSPEEFPDEEEVLVPIFPVHATWYNNRGHMLDRTQFPLLYGYAITIHKSQGELDNFGGGAEFMVFDD